MRHAVVLLELGGVILGLGILGRLAGRFGLSAIPLYLLAGLAFGEGGLLPLVTAHEFIEIGASIGVILSPGSSSSPSGAFCQANTAWKIGVCPRLRSGCNSSTSFSNGRS